MRFVRSLALLLAAATVGLLAPRTAAAQATRGRVALGSVTVNGPVPVAEARRVLTASMRAFEQCYQDRLRERSGLAGRTVTRIFVSSDGGPIVAQVDESNVGDPELERCLKRASLVLSFREHESADSHVRFELRFGDARSPSGTAHTVTAGPEDPRFRANAEGGSPGEPPAALRAQVNSEVVDLSGARPEEQVATGLRRAMPRLRTCYERSLAQDRTRVGDVQVRFVIDERGRAQSVHVENDGVGDATLARCIANTVATTRFGAGRGGTAEVVARVRMSPPQGLTTARTTRSG